MSDRLPWFKCDPSRLLGAIGGMNPDEALVYITILLRIYEVGGPIQDTEKTLARRTGIPAGRVAKAIAGLIEFDKVERVGAFLDSATTHEHLAAREKLIIDAVKAGNESAKKRKSGRSAKDKVNQQKEATPVEPASTPVERDGNHLDLEEEPERKKEGNLTVSCPKRVRTRLEYPSDFLEFWRAYPVDQNMGKQEAFAEWQRLGPDERAAAIASCPSFRLYCQTHKDYRPLHASRYLARGRFEGHLGASVAASASVFVKLGTMAWKAWDAWYRSTNGQAPPVNREGTGWYFPSETPPAIEVVA